MIATIVMPSKVILKDLLATSPQPAQETYPLTSLPDIFSSTTSQIGDPFL